MSKGIKEFSALELILAVQLICAIILGPVWLALSVTRSWTAVAIAIGAWTVLFSLLNVRALLKEKRSNEQ